MRYLSLYLQAGNLEYDGERQFIYDAWNRLVEVKRAYGNTPTITSKVGTIRYDGTGRRVSKAISESGDWSNGSTGMTCHYYYDGQAKNMIETRNGSDESLTQHVWGLTYVDELLRIDINDDPATENVCVDYTYYALQDANFNVLGLVESDGDLAERYEYTPYGQRTIYKSAGSDDDLCMAPILESQRKTVDSPATAAYGICDIGHQGLMHDKEFGLIYNRARYLSPKLGRFLQRDPLGYVDGMNLYEYVRSGPVGRLDPMGLAKLAHGWDSGDSVWVQRNFGSEHRLGAMEWHDDAWHIRTKNDELVPHAVAKKWAGLWFTSQSVENWEALAAANNKSINPLGWILEHETGSGWSTKLHILYRKWASPEKPANFGKLNLRRVKVQYFRGKGANSDACQVWEWDEGIRSMGQVMTRYGHTPGGNVLLEAYDAIGKIPLSIPVISTVQKYVNTVENVESLAKARTVWDIKTATYRVTVWSAKVPKGCKCSDAVKRGNRYAWVVDRVRYIQDRDIRYDLIEQFALPKNYNNLKDLQGKGTDAIKGILEGILKTPS